MTKKITYDDLVKMAQKLARESSRKQGYPLLDDAEQLLTDAAFRMQDIEGQNTQLRASLQEFLDLAKRTTVPKEGA